MARQTPRSARPLPPVWRCAGEQEPFAELGIAALATVLHGSDPDPHAATAHVMDGFSQLTLHSDVPEGVRGLPADLAQPGSVSP